MELALILLFLGACCIRRAARQDEPGDYAREPAKPGLWRKLRSFWNSNLQPAAPETPGPQKDTESLQIRQKPNKESGRVETHLSYQQKGRTVSIRCQENMTLEFAGMKLQLEPSGLKVHEVPQQAGGEVIHLPPIECDGNGRRAQARPNRDQRGQTGNRGMRQEAGEAAEEKWSFS